MPLNSLEYAEVLKKAIEEKLDFGTYGGTPIFELIGDEDEAFLRLDVRFNTKYTEHDTRTKYDCIDLLKISRRLTRNGRMGIDSTRFMPLLREKDGKYPTADIIDILQIEVDKRLPAIERAERKATPNTPTVNQENVDQRTLARPNVDFRTGKNVETPARRAIFVDNVLGRDGKHDGLEITTAIIVGYTRTDAYYRMSKDETRQLFDWLADIIERD